MNKFVLLALLGIFLTGGVFAASKPVKISVGSVVSYTAGDIAKGTPAVLVVKVGKREEPFLLGAKTIVESKDKKPLEPASLKAGTRVRVRFTRDAKKVMTALSVILK